MEGHKRNILVIFLFVFSFVKCDIGIKSSLTVIESQNITETVLRNDSNLENRTKAGPASFWQLTDVHWDIDYSPSGDKTNMCHNLSSSSNSQENGYYGDILCDAASSLVHSALQAMKNFEPNPQFILWTGDNAPHTGDQANFTVVFKLLKDLTDELRMLFGSKVPLLPVLGNHDTYPQSQYPSSGESFYGKYLEEGNWKAVLPVEAQEEFKIAGYYEYKLNKDISILVLNTNLYHKHRHHLEGLEDPGGQFKWMEKKLQNAKSENKKVFVSAHIPPGYWERSTALPFLNVTYNNRFVDILNDFGEIIIAHIYGHEHTDSFKIFASSHDDLKSVSFIAPSITPLSAPGLVGGTAINPSIRLYTYDTNSVLDYFQYNLNLTEANTASNLSCIISNGSLGCESEPKPAWKLYYKAKESFGVESLDIKGMAQVYSKLHTNDTFFQQYFVRNSAGIDNTYCNQTCKMNHMCAIVHLKVDSLQKCMGHVTPNKTHHHADVAISSYTYPTDNSGIITPPYEHFILAITVAAVALTLILGAMLTIIVVRRRRILSTGNGGPDFEWGNRHNGYKPLSLEAD